MKRNNKILILSTLFLSIFAVQSFSNKQTTSAHADGEWATIDTKILPTITRYTFDFSQAYIYFSVTPNDYNGAPASFVDMQAQTYFNLSDYNFLSYIQLSNDNVNYVPFSTVSHPTHTGYIFKDGKIWLDFRLDSETTPSDTSYQYIKILEGCEFPSYDYCANGGTKKKYVQQETTLSHLIKTTDDTTYNCRTATYEEIVPKKDATFTNIAPGWNNSHYSNNPKYRELILSFGVPGTDYLARDHVANATNRAINAYDIGNKLTFNGLPIYKVYERYPDTTVSYAHGNSYLYIYYPLEVLQLTKNYSVPTLHIEVGTEFMDSLLSEVTLKFVGSEWVVSDAEDFKIENPLDLDVYSTVDLPFKFGNQSHRILMQLPSRGSRLAFTINTADFDFTDLSVANVILFDGLYNCLLAVYPAFGLIQLTNKENNEMVQQYTGLKFVNDTDYLFEIEIICGAYTTYRFAINHFLVIDYRFENNKAAICDMWVLDTSGCLIMDHAKELKTYHANINYSGTSTYDFIEGDSAYNFTNVVKAFDLYNDSVNNSNVEYVYEDGAVTEGKYNAGTWQLLIKLVVEDEVVDSKLVTINVHGKESIAKVYYDDGDPIEVPIGSKLVPPTNPSTYRDGEYDYVFDGWYLEGAKWDFENDVVQGDMHLQAKYIKTAHHYVVTVKFEGIERIDETYSLTKDSSLPFVLFDLDGATFEVFQNGNKITSLTVQDDVTITVKYTVVFTYVEPVEPTCTEDGHIGYYTSSVYGDYKFADSDGREIVSDIVIPKLNHDIVHLNYQDSTCAEAGHVDCYYCKNCHKHFADENGENELIEWEIAKKSHVLTHHSAVAPTCLENGNVEYWTCANEPGVYYGDQDGTFKLDSIVLNAIGHEYINPTYSWEAVDGGYKCTASVACLHCHNVITETKVANQVVLNEATCCEEGHISYSVKFDNELFNTQTKIVDTPKKPHNYVFVSEVGATKEIDGVKEHYECSDCHKYFIKDGDAYIETEYNDLIYQYNKPSGCKGDITSSSLLILFTSGGLSILLLLRKKEEK